MTVDIGAKVSVLAASLGCVAQRGSTWFDGFWDFVVEHRSELDAAWQIAASEWAMVFLSPTATAHLRQAHVFVEAKDSRPGAHAPWPVSSIVLAPGASVRTADRDRHERSFDTELAARVRAFGYEPLVGYWGVHAAGGIDLAQSDPIERSFAELPNILDSCRRLALTLK